MYICLCFAYNPNQNKQNKTKKHIPSVVTMEMTGDEKRLFSVVSLLCITVSNQFLVQLYCDPRICVPFGLPSSSEKVPATSLISLRRDISHLLRPLSGSHSCCITEAVGVGSYVVFLIDYRNLFSGVIFPFSLIFSHITFQSMGHFHPTNSFWCCVFFSDPFVNFLMV